VAYTLDSVSIRGLRPAHFKQLLAAYKDVHNSGEYYGNKEQYYRRSEDLLHWLEGLVYMTSDPDARIPKA